MLRTILDYCKSPKKLLINDAVLTSLLMQQMGHQLRFCLSKKLSDKT